MPMGKVFRHIHGLDLLRFFAAFIVMLDHYTYRSWILTDGPALFGNQFAVLQFWAPVTWVGRVGVEIFFVISGYVIAYSAESSTAFDFFRSRVLRLMPAIWICSTITLGVLLFLTDEPLLALLKAWLKANLFFISPNGWIDGVYWTLVVEVVFYGLVFVFLCLNRFRWIVPAMAAIGLYSAAHSLAVAVPALEPVVNIVSSMIPFQPSGHMAKYGCYFALGTFIWLVLAKGVTRWRMTIAAACLAGGMAGILYRAIAEIATLPPVGLLPWSPVFVFAGAVLFLVLSCIVADIIPSKRGAHIIRMMGLMTYPLYLVHDVVGHVLIRIATERGFSMGTAIFGMMALSIAISLAVVFLERRIRPLAKHLIDRAGAAIERRRTAPRLFQATDALPVTRSLE